MKLIISIFLLLLASTAFAGDGNRLEFREPHMGTVVRIVVHAADGQSAQRGVRAAFERIAAIEQILSDYRPDSEISQLCRRNDRQPGQPHAMSEELANVLELAQEISAATDGMFDVTVGPLTKLWREARRSQVLPMPEELARARQRVGYTKLTLDKVQRTVVMQEAQMRLDFGGIGKGYAAQAALQTLREAGLPCALVAIGGDLAVGDAPPGRTGWNIEVQPLQPGDPPRMIALANAAVSTSGDLYQHVVIGGVRYSHILDPTTALGMTGSHSVTVIASHGAWADGLATAAVVMPADQLLPLLKKKQAAGLSVRKTSADAVESCELNGFEAYWVR